MNPHERLAELQTVLRTRPEEPCDEFNRWQAKVSALLGFDLSLQNEFRQKARSAIIASPQYFSMWIREIDVVIAQAIAALEFGNDVLTEPRAESGRPLDVFISYSTADSNVAEDLANRLRALQLSVFLAHDTITTGPAWRSQVGVALRRCTVAVMLLSSRSIQSDWVRYEIGAIWALNKPAAPALLDCEPSQLPELLRDYQGRSVAEVSERAVFCHEVERLVRNTQANVNHTA
jgi:hypothetical protein